MPARVQAENFYLHLPCRFGGRSHRMASVGIALLQQEMRSIVWFQLQLNMRTSAYLALLKAASLDVRAKTARTPHTASGLVLIFLRVRVAQRPPGRTWAFRIACLAAILAMTSSCHCLSTSLASWQWTELACRAPCARCRNQAPGRACTRR